MPLPDSNAGIWPPNDVAAYHRQQERWAAWWSGDKYDLGRLTAEHAEASLETGRRWFWERRDVADKTKATRNLHVALASDIASTSADLIFGEPPKLRTEQDGAQGRWDEISDLIGYPNLLLEAAEVSAALGSVWLRPVWDTEVADHPLLTVIDPVQAVPDFRFRTLQAVTFHEVLLVRDTRNQLTAETKLEVWRHLERHEPGVILHGLYVGTEIELGRRVPLVDHPETAAYEDVVNIPEAVTGILPEYVPNALPNREHRRLPIGRSDYAGAEDELDSLDEAWSSWMRDLRLGTAKIIAPREFLEHDEGGRGQAKTLDLDRELFTGLNIADLEKLTDPIRQIQFDLRVQEHEQTCMALVERIVSQAGYSPQTFGLHIEGRAESGTALKLREGKTWRTQGRKQRYWKSPVTRTAEKLLQLDQALFGGGAASPVSIQWPEMTDEPLETAQWLSLVRAAQAISRRNAIKAAQPQLEDAEVDAELAAIEEEHKPVAMPEFEPDLP